MKELRKSKNISLSFAAKVIGLHRETLRKIENGQASLPLEAKPTLAKLYGVSERELEKHYFEDRKEVIK